MKIVTWVLVALLLFGLLTAIVSPLPGNIPGSESGTSPPYDETPGDELPDDSTENEETVTPVVLISEDQMLFESTYKSDDESVYVKTYPVYTNATVSADLKSVVSDYYNQSVDGIKWDRGNYFELTFPHQENGIYSIDYTINYYGDMPSIENYVKSFGYVNSLYIDKLDVTAEDVVDYSSDIGYTLRYTVSFDFDTNYMSVKITNESGGYSFNIYDITALSAENTGGKLVDVQYRSGFVVESVKPAFEKLEVIDFKYSYHPEGSSIVPQEVVEDNAGTVIEGGYEILSQGDTLSFATGTSYAAGNQSITTDFMLTDYQMTQLAYMPVWPHSFTYIGPDSGSYGSNTFNIHLPNYESGKYVFTLDLQCEGSGSFFYPTKISCYLKTPGLLNNTNLFLIEKSKVSLASLAGYKFKTDSGGMFTMQCIFDFDENVVNCNLIDLNGKSFSLGEQSLSMYREYYDSSTGQTINTKVKPITLRLQIPSNNVEVNPNNTSVAFNAWSYKKLIEET